MKRVLFLSLLVGIGSLWGCQIKRESNTTTGSYVLVIHGGAGAIKKENLEPELEKKYREALNKALDIGDSLLQNGATALDAVEHTIRFLEDCPLFNAGKGAVFTHEGHNELDASIMDGETLDAGAVAGVGNVRNPISLARKVMTDSPHVMLSGSGASEFARKMGLEVVDSSYFFTPKRWELLQKQLERSRVGKFGTVGCVALDMRGHLAAGTSTGGMSNKRWGRIGDSPIIGAGTYANKASCAISCTGHGEYFIRYTVAREIAALMEYKRMTLQEAAQEVVLHRLKDVGASGGIIGVDRHGAVAMVFNSSGMFRGYVTGSEKREVAIFRKE